jgi:hypothetical protein
MTSVQYRIVVAKRDERAEGPDDADLVLTVPLDVVRADGFDATVAFMQGRLKSAGPTGPLFDLLRSGEADAALTKLAARL